MPVFGWLYLLPEHWLFLKTLRALLSYRFNRTSLVERMIQSYCYVPPIF